MAGSLTDITSLKTANARLRYEARHDSLTGLLNRAAFMSSLKQAIEERKENNNYQFAVLFLDLDRFKSINDTLGHLVGDEILITVARRLQNCVRTGDIAARLGGDEFTILLNNIEGPSEAREIAERIQKKLALPVNVDSQQIFICASIGIALGNQDYERLEDIMRDADTAMYRAKALSHAEHQLLGIKRQGRIVTNLGLEKELWGALENQEFEIYYQPIVSLNSDEFEGIEALLRWQHPKRGLLSPKDFIPLLEETGLIVPLGEWVLRTACLQMQAWHALGLRPPSVAVNMSARQFQQKNLVPLIQQVLNETGLTAKALKLEITEGVAMQNSDYNQNTLNGLRSIGLQLTIDDFGTGYSSLNRLTRLPIKSLKIDRSFVKDMGKSDNDKHIISAMIAMAHRINLKVIAEGVETVEQLAFLRSQQCDEMQGYLFSQPVPAEDVTKMLLLQNSRNGSRE
jgi:diguanylate cyclase (GGDEF)-like protein